MKTTVLADYKAKTSTGSRIHVAHNDLPLQVNQMIVWMMNYPAMAMGDDSALERTQGGSESVCRSCRDG